MKNNSLITYGTFDLFHIGHVRLLQRLSLLAPKVIVGLSTDEFNAIKGKQSFFSYEERKEILLSCKYVNEVFPEYNWEQKKDDIIKYSAKIFAMGNDWEGKFDYLSDVCEVVYLPRTEDISTTEIKRSLSLVTSEQCEDLKKSISNALKIISVISDNINTKK